MLRVGSKGIAHSERALRRFNAKIKVDCHGCWQWTGSTNGVGYSVFGWNGRGGYAHRFAYEVAKGPIPEGMTIDHLCRNRGCSNPQHLEAVPEKVNILRGTGWSARNARKDACAQGHPYDEENTYRVPDGGRACRECHRQHERLRRTGTRDLPPKPAACINGHPWTSENRYTNPNGTTQCRRCAAERVAARRRRGS